jgi:hypothetical protein
MSDANGTVVADTHHYYVEDTGRSAWMLLLACLAIVVGPHLSSLAPLNSRDEETAEQF